MPTAIENDLEVQSLKKEILRLTSENNTLHQQLIEKADISDQKARKTSLVIRRLENEINDLKFLNSQYLTRIQQEQRLHDEERKKLDDLLKKWQVWTGSKGSKPSLPVQKLEVMNGLEPLSLPLPTFFPPHEPHRIDLVKLAETELKKLQLQVQEYEFQFEETQQSMEALKLQLKNREEEIVRLTSMTHPLPMFSSSSSSHPQSRSSSPLIEKSSRVEILENQLELLQESLQDLEKKLAEKAHLEEDLCLAQKKNEKLIQSLTDLENQVTHLKSDYPDHYPHHALVQDLKNEITELQSLLQASQKQQDELTQTLSNVLHTSSLTTPSSLPSPPFSSNPLSNKDAFEPVQSSTLKASNPMDTSNMAVVWSLEQELKDVKVKLNQAKLAERQLEKIQPDHDRLKEQYAQLHQTHREVLDKNQVLQKECKYTQSMYDQLLTELKLLDQSTLELNTYIQTLIAQKENFQSLYQQLMDQPKSSSCEACSQMKTECSAHCFELQQKTQELNTLKQREQQYQLDLTDLANVKVQLATTERQLELLQSTHTQLNATLQQQLSILQQQSHELTDLKLEQEKHTRDALMLQHKQQEVVSLKSELQQHQSMYLEVQQQVQQQTYQLEKLNQKLNDLESEKKNLMTELNHVTTDLTSLIKENQLLNSDLHTSVQGTQHLTNELTQLQHQFKSLQEAYTKLEQERHQWMQHYKKLLQQQGHTNETEVSLKTQVEQMKLDLLSKEQKLSQLNVSLDQWKTKYDEKVKQLQDAHHFISPETHKLISCLEKELDQQKEKNSQLEQVIQTERMKTMKQVQQLKQELQHQTQKVGDDGYTDLERKLQRELEQTQHQLNEMKQLEEKEKETTQVLKKELTQLQQELIANDSKMQRKKKMLESEQLFSKILQADQQPS